MLMSMNTKWIQFKIELCSICLTLSNSLVYFSVRIYSWVLTLKVITVFLQHGHSKNLIEHVFVAMLIADLKRMKQGTLCYMCVFFVSVHITWLLMMPNGCLKHNLHVYNLNCNNNMCLFPSGLHLNLLKL